MQCISFTPAIIFAMKYFRSLDASWSQSSIDYVNLKLTVTISIVTVKCFGCTTGLLGVINRETTW